MFSSLFVKINQETMLSKTAKPVLKIGRAHV